MQTYMANAQLVSVREVDYLDQDPPLRGQNYVCLSFVSPEDVIKKKEVYFFEEFMKSFSADMTEWFSNMSQKYPDDADALRVIKERYSYVFDRDALVDEYMFFVNTNSAQLEDDYFKQNDFHTSIRGIKVRGVFDSLREAEIRAQVLKKIDDKFNVYVAQVGCWCPWSPNPDDIADQEYAETHLNTMMKKYKENQEKRDQFYMERKRDLQFTKSTKTITDEDPWMTQKNDEASTSEPLKDDKTTDTPSQESCGSCDTPSSEINVETTVLKKLVEEVDTIEGV